MDVSSCFWVLRLRHAVIDFVRKRSAMFSRKTSWRICVEYELCTLVPDFGA